MHQKSFGGRAWAELTVPPRPHLDLWGREEKEKRGRGMIGKEEGDEKGREEEGYKGEQQK